MRLVLFPRTYKNQQATRTLYLLGLPVTYMQITRKAGVKRSAPPQHRVAAAIG